MKAIEGFNGRYSVTKEGEIFSHISNKYLKQRKDHGGYFGVSLYLGKKTYSRTVHSLVALAFLGDRPENLVVDHIDGDRANNSIENLQYITIRENAQKGERTKNRVSDLPIGVCLDGKKYRAQKRFGQKLYSLGVFDSPQDAFLAYQSCDTESQAMSVRSNLRDFMGENRSIEKKRNKFAIRKRINGKRENFGVFNSIEDARNAVVVLEKNGWKK
jgi:hypothetical protein